MCTIYEHHIDTNIDTVHKNMYRSKYRYCTYDIYRGSARVIFGVKI